MILKDVLLTSSSFLTLLFFPSPPLYNSSDYRLLPTKEILNISFNNSESFIWNLRYILKITIEILFMGINAYWRNTVEFKYLLATAELCLLKVLPNFYIDIKTLSLKHINILLFLILLWIHQLPNKHLFTCIVKCLSMKLPRAPHHTSRRLYVTIISIGNGIE